MATKNYIGPNRLSEIFSYIKAELDKKVTAVSGKGLSSNDYTTTEKNKLAGISSGAEVNVQSDWDETNTSSDAFILHKPESMPASDVYSWAKAANKPSYTFSEITSKPTTISGYGITDAKIANGVITLGSNTITPLTSHQTVTDNNPTLAWGTKSKVATIGSTEINVTMPANPNTNTTYSLTRDGESVKLTPSSGTAQSISLSSLINGLGEGTSPSTANDYIVCQYAGGGTTSTTYYRRKASNVINGTLVKAALGTGSGTTTYLRNDGSWATPTDTNTTYTLTRDGTSVKLTPSSGTAQSVSLDSLLTNLATWTATPTDDTYLIRRDTAGGAAYGQVKFSTVWTYIKSKVDSNFGFVMSSAITYDPHTKKLTCSKSSQGWDQQAYSNTGYIDDVCVSWKPGQTNAYIMFGLTSDPSTNPSYDSIDYCWYTQNNGALLIYENGTQISSISGHTTYSAGDELRIEYSGGYIRYYHNNVQCRRVARTVTITNPLYVDSSFYSTSGYVYDVSFGCGMHAAGFVTYTNGNEINFAGGPQASCWFNYRNADTNSSATSADINYYFGNYAGTTVRSILRAGLLYSGFKSGTWVNSLTSSVINLEDTASSFGGWISGPTKDGRIVISTYQGNDNKLYFGYGERGRTTNSYAKSMTWEGTTGTLTADNFVGPLTGNVTGNCSGSSGSCTGNAATATKATQDGSGNVITSTYLKAADVARYMSTGDATVSATGYRDLATYITLTEGKYFIVAWATFKGGTGNKALLICRASDGAAYAQTWEDSTINQSYPKIFSCFYNATVSSGSTLYVKPRVYTTNKDSYGGISGGIFAIKVP